MHTEWKPLLPPSERKIRCLKCGSIYYGGNQCPHCGYSAIKHWSIVKAHGSLRIFVARLILFTVLVVASVSAVNVVTLWIFNLITDVGTWLIILIFESLALMFLGSSAEYRIRKHARGETRGPLSSSDFWISLGLAGVVLLVLAVYMVSQYY